MDYEQVDLILTDLSMPVLDGYRTTQLIRARPGLTNVPIVAVTAYALNEESEAAMQIGCTEYLTKPFKSRIKQRRKLHVMRWSLQWQRRKRPDRKRKVSCYQRWLKHWTRRWAE